MKIIKFGHCCMLIEEKGMRILTDPGAFTADKHVSLTSIDAILYTHEHADHYHLQSLQQLLKNNPKAVVLCNPGVAALLAKEGIAHQVIGDGGIGEVGRVEIAGHGTTHAIIHSSLPQAQNTGFMIAGKLWYPGDELTVDPGVRPEIMALPVAGPWMKIGEAMDYCLRLKPQCAFPVHDMILNPAFTGFLPQMVSTILEPRGVRFLPVSLDTEYDL